MKAIHKKLPASVKNLEKQMRFLAEIEKLKIIYRWNSVLNGTRRENSAEHSWHLAVMAMLLQEHSDLKNIHVARVMKMLLIHDIVEIDAGDTFLYSKKGNTVKAGKESAAAKRIFGLLPAKQKKEFLGLWKEFEKRETPDALFAAALDGLQPVLNRYLTGHKWNKLSKITSSQVLEKKEYIGQTSKRLWEYTKDLIALSEKAGYYIKPRNRDR